MLIFLLIFWVVGIVFRLAQLQIINHDQSKAKVLEQNQNINVTYPKRGSIYDRRGNILALSIPCYSVFYKSFKNETLELQMEKIKRLKKILKLPPKELELIRTRIEKNASFIWIKRKIDPEKSNKILGLNIEGLYLTEENKRFYPNGKLAAHTLGQVNIDCEGYSGLEYKYNSILEGEKGKRLILRDAKRRKYRFETLKEPTSGKDLILTIDKTIQYIAERELERAIQENNANWGTVIISIPQTGEILAMADYPLHDLNNTAIEPRIASRNRATQHIYSPGSTFKIITASAALESNTINPDDSFDCSKGSVYFAGKTFSDYKRFGVLSFPEVIIHSSNVGAIKIGEEVGKENLYNTIKAFGFGEKTGIDLPEEKGIFRTLNDWSNVSLASLSIGYEISVTAIQTLQAINIIANKGKTCVPKVVKKVPITPKKAKGFPVLYKRVISEETALKLASILKEAVERGTGTAARIDGYTAVGKTGTSQKFDPLIKRYSSASHTSSFVGFVQTERPVFSIIVVIDDPKGQYYGSQVAAPLFKKIAVQVIRYLRIPPKKDHPEVYITAKYWEKNKR